MTDDPRCIACGRKLKAVADLGMCPSCLEALGARAQGVGPQVAGITKGTRSPSEGALTTPEAEAEAVSSDDGHTTRFFRHPELRYIGDYQLIAELARGGMGIVYRAQQLSVRREVALKLMRSGNFASEVEVERFRREAEAAARLDHPNIVPIHEVGVHEGLPYFTQKLIQGRSLAKALAQGAFAPHPAEGKAEHQRQRQVATLMVQVSQGVHHAHQRGVLHRDLKPNNILLDDDGTPYVADFGCAKLSSSTEQMTLAGLPLGTPGYMSPEQAAGRLDEITIASDLYSLGVILYELLTGRALFEGSSGEILDQVKNRDPKRPRRFNPGLDRDLEVITLRCLEKDPGRRYPSALALADDLQRWLRFEPIRARPVTPFERTVKWVRRRPAIAALACAVALSTVLGLAGVISQWRRAETTNLRLELERAEGLLQNARLAPALASLAYVCRQHPTDRLARERILYGLTLRSMPALAGPPIALGTAVRNLELSANEHHLLLESDDGSVELADWRQDTRFSWQQPGQPAPLRRLVWIPPDNERPSLSPPDAPPRFSPQAHLAVTARHSYVQLWQVADGQPIGPPLEHPGPVRITRFSPDGERLLTVTGNQLRLWSTAPVALLQSWESPGRIVMCAEFGPGRDQLSIGTDQGSLIIWDTSVGKAAAMHGISDPPSNSRVRRLAIDPDGRFVAACANEGRLLLVDTLLEVVFRRELPVTSFRFLEFLPGPRLLAITEDLGGENHLNIIDPANRELLLLLPAQTLGRDLEVVVSSPTPQHSQLLVAFADGRVRVLDLDREAVPVGEQLELPTPPTAGCLMRRPGTFLLAAGGRLLPWRIHPAFPALESYVPTTNNLSSDLEDPWLAAKRAAFETRLGVQLGTNEIAADPRRRRIATVSHGRSLRIWDANRLLPRTDAIVHPASINTVQFSPDGKWLLTATAQPDSSLRLWDSATGLPLSDPLRPGGEVYEARFARDGRVVTALPGWRWQLPPSAAAAAPWLPDLAEVLAGWRLNPQRILTPVDPAEVAAFVARLSADAPGSEATHWALQFWSPGLRNPASQ